MVLKNARPHLPNVFRMRDVEWTLDVGFKNAVNVDKVLIRKIRGMLTHFSRAHLFILKSAHDLLRAFITCWREKLVIVGSAQSTPTHPLQPRMSFQNTVKHSNGETLTGRLWRKDHPFFKDLPFYSNILRADEIEGSLRLAFGERAQEENCYCALLVVSRLAIWYPK